MNKYAIFQVDINKETKQLTGLFLLVEACISSFNQVTVRYFTALGCALNSLVPNQSDQNHINDYGWIKIVQIPKPSSQAKQRVACI